MNAIETTYRGYKFRSRLEAKWANVFDQLGWPWEYEPIDLNGYIPDFFVMWPHATTLVEIKPALDSVELHEHTDKIDQSGWDGHSMILGAAIGDHYAYPTIGILTAKVDEDGYTSGTTGMNSWDDALFHKCGKCDRPSVHHETAGWECRVCGAYAGDGYLRDGSDILRAAWAAAHNATKWKPSR